MDLQEERRNTKYDNVKYKACLVVKGYGQKESVEFNEVFSPVGKHSSISMLLFIVAMLDLQLK